MTRVLKYRVALAMTDRVRLRFANGRGRCGPDGSCVLIAQINDLAWRIAHGIVRPRRQPILAAVYRPGIARTRLSYLKSKIACVRNDVGPGRRRPLFCAEHDYVLATALMKTTQAVEESQFRQGNCGFGICLRGQTGNEGRR